MLITTELKSNLAAFNERLTQYRDLTNKTLDEVLEKKGKSLSISLYQGFSAHKWVSAKRNSSAVLGAMFAKATRLPRSAYRAGNRLTNPDGGQVPVRKPKAESPWSASIPAETKSGDAMGAWRSAVVQEMLRRKAGVGVLGASFLWFRYRSNNADGRFLVKNKGGGVLGSVEKGPGFIRIVGNTAGLSYVDLKYGIVSAAFARETDDMEVYIQRKMQELWGSLSKGIGKAA